jgi:hypothetical protein
VSHTRTFDVSDVSSLIERLNEQFEEYELFVPEIDAFGEESTYYDKYKYGTWYSYTGRKVFCHSPYGESWWNEYDDGNGNIELF